MSITKSNKIISKLVLDLPEVYQEVYDHPEFSHKSSRISTERLSYVENIYDLLKKTKGRDLNVLDLGCAQGFFTFNLAKKGATVHGVDYLDKNLNLCKALAKEHSDFKVTFQRERLEIVVESIKKGQYDLVLGLSVFHHVAYEKGFDFAQKTLMNLSKKVEVGIFEFALPSEPLHWAKSQPDDSREFLVGYSFIHKLTYNKTHLSEILRPLYVASSRYWIINNSIEEFKSFKKESHDFNHGVFKNTRSYFFGEDLFLKHFYLDNEDLKEVNLREYSREVDFLKKHENLVPYLKIVDYGQNDKEAWIVTSKLNGKLLSELIRDNDKYDEKKIIGGVLKQLVDFEDLNLYHTDVRAWNVMVSATGEPFLIDFGSISSDIKDCSWPDDVFYSFIIFAREVIDHKISDPIPHRNCWLDPKNFPSPYRELFNSFLSSNLDKKNFKNLFTLFKSIEKIKYIETIYSDLNSLLSDKINTQILEKNDYIFQLESRLKIQQKIEKEIEYLKENISDLSSEKSDLYLKNSLLQNDINRMTSTKLWRLSEFVRKILKKLLPKSSYIRKTIKYLMKLVIFFLKKTHVFFKSNFIFSEKYSRKINKTSKKIVYIGHSYHDKTKSTSFLIDYLKEHFEVEVILDETWLGKPLPNLDFIDESYLGVIFFQNIYSPEIINKIRNKNIIFFPMYDRSGGFKDEYWKQYKNIKFINFSKNLHLRLVNLGLDSLYVQYFPKPKEFSKGDKNRIFFWQRLTHININILEKLLKNKDKIKIHLHKAIDPEHLFVKPTKKQESIFSITYSNWFKNKNDSLNLVKKAAIYIAPREYEGIGMSFLEAMSMGKAVIAVDNPTMNEYIKHGKTGYLFNLNNIKEIDLDNLELVQKNCYKFMKNGYNSWEINKTKILDFIYS